MDENRLDNIVECAYNMDNGYVEVWFTDGNMLRISGGCSADDRAVASKAS